MMTYVLIPGAGSNSWYWHLIVPELRARGHDVVAPDLPVDDDSAGLAEYTDVVVTAIGSKCSTSAASLSANSASVALSANTGGTSAEPSGHRASVVTL